MAIEDWMNITQFVPTKRDYGYLKMRWEHPEKTDLEICQELGIPYQWYLRRKRSDEWLEWFMKEMQRTRVLSSARIDALVYQKALEGKSPSWSKLFYQRCMLGAFGERKDIGPQDKLVQNIQVQILQMDEKELDALLTTSDSTILRKLPITIENDQHRLAKDGLTNEA